jgi:ATP-dependent Lhr-like helicase
MEQAVALAREHRRHKILVFCNSRKECEHEAAQIISRRLWPAANVLVHHASLSAPVRKEVERTLLESTHALCFATTTLELGVDIGDVSAVFLYRPPLLPSSFQQRIGRACRRERSIFAVGIAQAPDDEEVFQAFADMARAAAVEPGHYEPDWSVVVQQLFSLLFAHPAGLPRYRLYDYLSPLCEPDLFHAILDHLVHQQHLVGRGPLVQAGESVMTAGEKGDIHANIPDERHRTLVDSTTGKVIGEAMVGPEEHSLILAGRIWTVARTQGSRVFVRPSSEKPKSLLFSRRSGHGKYYSYLPVPVQERMAGRGSAHE